MIEYIIFENDWSASQYADELNTYDNEGKNYFVMQRSETQYYNVSNVLVEEFLPQYTQSNVGTMRDVISMFSGYGWNIEYVDEVNRYSNDDYILAESDEEQNDEMFNDVGVHTYELIDRMIHGFVIDFIYFVHIGVCQVKCVNFFDFFRRSIHDRRYLSSL